jgi:diaminohydroxyphosphoribosylaminopyrimidine deaminase/5-amino-6-(5-phosphoribosylamino)uracil reductase
LVEAGATLSGAFIEAGLVDELIVYIAPKLLGSDARPLLGFAGLTQMSEAWQLSIESVTQIETDLRVVLTPTA